MKIRHNPFHLIFSRGDVATRLACLDFFGFSDSPQARTCLLELIKQQRGDGTFPSSLNLNDWGMRETVRNTLLLLKVGLPSEGVNVQCAVRFVLKQQHPDGGWCENPSLHIPPEQTWLSNLRSISWLTADILDLLRQTGMQGRPEYGAAMEWIKAMQIRDGGWPSLAKATGDQGEIEEDPDATSQITFLLGEICGEGDPAYLKGRVLFERYLEASRQDVERGYWIRRLDGKRGEIEVYHLTHLLLSWLLDPPRRFQSGYDGRDPRVRKMMETLIDLQEQDGGWIPFWAEESSPVYTAIALKVLVLSGCVARTGLEADIRAYAN